MDGLPSKEFCYLLSCEVDLDVAVKVHSLVRAKSGVDLTGISLTDDIYDDSPFENNFKGDELYVSLQVFSYEYAAHVVPMSTRSSWGDDKGRRVSWREWVILPVSYKNVDPSSCIFLSVWSAKRGLIGHSYTKLFDKDGRLHRGRLQLPVECISDCESAWIAMRNNVNDSSIPETPQAKNDSMKAAARHDVHRLWRIGEEYNHGEIHRLPWLDHLTRKRIQDIRNEIIDDENESQMMLTIELPYFEYPVLFEERVYYSETMEAIFSMRSRQDTAQLFGSPTSTYPHLSESDPIKLDTHYRRGLDNPGSVQFPWESHLCTIHDPEMHAQTRLIVDSKELLNPVEVKYRKLNPGIIRGAVDKTLMPNKEERQRIYEIIHQQSGRLTRKAQDLLWKFSYSLASDRKALVKFVMSVDWGNRFEHKQAKELLSMWAPIDIADALRLLGDEPEFRNGAIRAHAIKTLDGASAEELHLYLLQLVQALRYDNVDVETVGSASVNRKIGTVHRSSSDSDLPVTDSFKSTHSESKKNWTPGPLAIFLIKRAQEDETLLSYLVWYLRTAEEGKSNAKVFSKVKTELFYQLEQSATGLKTISALENQRKFVKKLVDMGKEGRGRALSRQQILHRMLTEEKGKYRELCAITTPIVHPLWPATQVLGVDPSSLRVLNSRTQPLKVDFISREVMHDDDASNGECVSPTTKTPVLFKVGDDLRQDQLVLQLLGVMDKMFKDVNLDLNLTLYRVLSFSMNEGMMEFVWPSMSLSQIQKRHGTIGSYFRRLARNQYESQTPQDRDLRLGKTDLPRRSEQSLYEELVARFIKSCAGYCMCTYVLCVGDRHLDNILIREDGALFHIDFGYIFGHDPRSWAVGPIRLTRDMIETMGGRGSPGFEKFVSYCCQAYRVLRKNATLILNLLHLMKDSQVENLFEDHNAVVEIVSERFELYRTDESAETWLLDKLRLCEDSFLTQFSDTAHNISLYFG